MLNKIPTSVSSLLETSFFRSSFVYLVGGVANAAIPFLLLPILTRHLTPTDYGVVGTSLVLVQMLSLFIGFNASGLIARSQFDNDFGAQQRLLSTMVILSSVLSIFLIVLFTAARNFVGNVTKFPSLWVPATVIIAYFGVIQAIYLILLQARKEPRKYISIQILLSGLNFGIALLLVVGAGMDWRGRMLAIIISAAIVAAICFNGLVSRLSLLRVIFDRSSLRSLLSFGIPLIPHTIGGWVMMMLPRLYLNNMATLADTGLYSVGYNIASPIALVIGAANQAYLPELFRRLSSQSLDKVRLAKILLIGAASLPIIAVLYGLSARFFLPLIVGPRFYAAVDHVFWLGLAFSMQGVYFVFGNFVIYSKKTYLLAWRADFLGGIATIVLCPLMIKLNGAIGAAQATFLAFSISAAGCFVASRKAHPMPWRNAALSVIPNLKTGL